MCSKALNTFSLNSPLGGLSTCMKASRSRYGGCGHLSRNCRLSTKTDLRHGYWRSPPTVASPSVQEPLTYLQNGFSTEKFNWFKNWWACQVLDNLKTDRPNKVTLLGKDFIVWKGHSGNWIAMDDECPHRLAPLSEGRIEDDGNLLCSYHAWRFNESGKCVKIPHAEDEKAHSVACNSPRSAVQTYPISTRGAILWIWPDNSASAFSDSEKASIPIEDDFADFLERSYEDGTYTPFFQTFQFGYESMMENGLDPVHLNATHHGVLPTLNRYESQPLRPKIVKHTNDRQGVVSIDIHNPPFLVNTRLRMELPGTVVYSSNDDKSASAATSYSTYSPIRAGESLTILAIVQHSQLKNKKKPNIIERALGPIATLMVHFLVLRLADGDISILLSQQRHAREKGPNFSKHCYTPTNADMLVMAFRRWFETAGECGAAYGGDVPVDQNAQKSREQLLDRYESHTKHCRLSSSVLRATETAISVFKFVRLASVVVGSAVLLANTSTSSVSLLSVMKSIPIVWSAVVLSFTSITLHLLQKLRSQFYYVGYDFTEMN